MKTLTAITTIILLTYFASCDNKTEDTSASTSSTSVINLKTNVVDSIKSVKEPEAIAMNFLIWYCNNRNNLTAIRMVNNASGESFDSTKFYSVNFQATEKYLYDIKESGFVSSAYIDHWKRYFFKADQQFKSNPQNDGPPENFEYDLILQSQEIDEDLESISKTKVESKTVQGDKAYVSIRLPSGQKLKFFLSRQGQSWLIDLIQSETGR
jgi:hypothetical protein